MSTIVLGGGPAGAAAACLLAGAGRAVRLVERHATATHKLCGEFIGPGAQAHLAALGIDLAALGAQPISHLRIVHGGRHVETALPFAGFGLTRKALDAALLRQAQQRGAELLLGTTVRQVAYAGRRFALTLDTADEIATDTLFLASGKQSLRGLSPAAPVKGDGWLGFKCYFQLSDAARDALSDHIELVLFEGGYAGLQLVETGWANLCLLVRRSSYVRAGGWDEFLAWLMRNAHLRHRLEGAVPQIDRPLGIAGRNYGSLHRPSVQDPPALFRLGDQAGIIEPFVGDGISIALHSAQLAVAAHLASQDASTYQRRLLGDIAGPIRRADWLAAALRHRLSGRALFAIGRAWPSLIREISMRSRLPLRTLPSAALSAHP